MITLTENGLERIIQRVKVIRLQPVVNTWKLTNFLETEDPLAYYLVFPKILDETWHEWEPETIWKTLERSYGIELSDVEKNKVNAIKAIYSETFVRDWEAFEKVSLALDGIIPEFDIMQDITPNQIAGALITANIVRLSEPELSQEVKTYCALRMIDHETLSMPEDMVVFQPYVYENSDRKDLIEMVKGITTISSAGPTEMDVQVVKREALRQFCSEFIEKKKTIVDDIYYFVR